METLKVAVIGTGFFSQYHYDAWSRIPEVSLAAVVYAQDERKAQDVAAQYGVPHIFDDVEEMLNRIRPDVVDIVTPPEAHMQIIKQAVAHGAAVITQKPLAPTAAEAMQIAEIAKSHTVVVHENWRFKPWFREAKKLLDAGELGEIYNISFRLRPGDGQGPEAYLQRQPYFQKMPRFLIHETGIHLVDSFRYLAGEIDSVTARLRRFNPVIAGEDAGQVLIDFTEGPAGLIDGNRLADFEASDPRKTMGELTIEGSKRQLRLDGEGRLHLHDHRGSSHEHIYHWEDRGYGGDSVFALQNHVINHLMHGTPVENTADEYIRNIQIEEAIYTSDTEGRRVTVDEAHLGAEGENAA